MQRILKILGTCCIITSVSSSFPATANAASSQNASVDETVPAPATNVPVATHQPISVIGHKHSNPDVDFLAAPNNISPKILPSVPVSVVDYKPKKEFFYNVLKPLKDYGITFHALLIDNFVSNVAGGVKPGSRLQNALGVIETNINLEKLLGWKGAQVHFGEDIFFLRDNDKHWSQQVGDNIVGYQPPHLFRGNYLSELTLDQKLFKNKLEVEFGRANISRYFLVPNCNQILTCFKDIWSQDAGISTFVYATWSGHAIYHITPEWYVQAAAAEVNNTVFYTNGWQWDTDGASGATGVGEIAYKRDFDKSAYPSMFEFLGYYNSSTVTDPIRTTNGTSQLYDKHSAPQQHTGMSGIFLSGQQYVWRKDHGSTRDPHGMALAVYGGAGTDFQTYAPIQAEAYLGAFVQAPFAGHPLDSYGIQFHWSKLGPREQQFLGEANKLSGGDGTPPGADHLVADMHAHVFLMPNVAFEPSLQYVINPNTYYAPMTAKHPHDVVEVGATLFIYLDKMAGFP